MFSKKQVQGASGLSEALETMTEIAGPAFQLSFGSRSHRGICIAPIETSPSTRCFDRPETR